MITQRATMFFASLFVVILSALFLSSSAVAEPNLIFTVNASSDVVDFLPGDGICETLSGNGMCTLRAAIMEANAHIGTDTIILPAATYLLTIAGIGEDAGATGDLDITDSLILQGENKETTTISAAGLGDRVLDISSNVASVSISHVSFGYANTPEYGAGIRTASPLALEYVVVFSNHSTTFAGGIYSSGPLTIRYSRVENNIADQLGGGIYMTDQLNTLSSYIEYNYSASLGGGIFGGYYSSINLDKTVLLDNTGSIGGGLYMEGDLIVVDESTFDQNSAVSGAGIYTSFTWASITKTTFTSNSASANGAAIFNSWTELTISDSVFNNGNAAGNGSGIVNDNGNISLSKVDFLNNSSLTGAGIENQGGTINGSDVLFEHNTSYQFGGGSALDNQLGEVNLHRAVFFNNSGYYTGPINNADTILLSDSTVFSNTTEQNGGGVNNNGMITLIRTTISANHSTNGGGIYNNGTSIVVDSTISNNQAMDNGAGIYSLGTTIVGSSTIARNLASSDLLGGIGGGIYADPATSVILKNTILFDNHRRLGFNFYDDDCYGMMTTQNYNLVGTLANCTLNGSQGLDLIGVDPLLGDLSENGGPTQTLALLDSSPAIDAANPEGCTDANSNILVYDQRGYRRNWDGNSDGIARCDMGSYEYGSWLQFFLPLIKK